MSDEIGTQNGDRIVDAADSPVRVGDVGRAEPIAITAALTAGSPFGNRPIDPVHYLVVTSGLPQAGEIAPYCGCSRSFSTAGGATRGRNPQQGWNLPGSRTQRGASALTSQLQPADFPRGHTVFAQGEPGDLLSIIMSGRVKIGNRSPNGQETRLAILGPSDMFGELLVFDPGPRTSSATTITAVRAVSMDRDAVRTWIADRPEIADQLLRAPARRLRRTNNNLADPSSPTCPAASPSCCSSWRNASAPKTTAPYA
jgi:hypothetical protein